MLRFAPAAWGREAGVGRAGSRAMVSGARLWGSAEARGVVDVTGVGNTTFTGAGAAATIGGEAGDSVADCGARALLATDATPSNKPAAAASAIVKFELRLRLRELCTTEPGARSLAAISGASLSGPWLCGGSLGGATDATAGGGRLGAGIARNVIFSLALIGAGSLGGGGGTLGRASGMSSVMGASPTRTTTACRGGTFKPGLAMKPPRGVSALRDDREPRSSGES
jgi:hypothetical protein